MKIGYLQLNLVIGAFDENTQKIIDGYTQLVLLGCDIVVGTELMITCYPPQDFLLREEFLEAQDNALAKIKAAVGHVPLIIGVATRNTESGKPLFNSAIAIQNGRVIYTQDKTCLPTYGVFDEARYFKSRLGTDPQVLIVNGQKVATLVCEDIWGGAEFINGKPLYENLPIKGLKRIEPDLLIVINASPYYVGKGNVRRELVGSIARELNCPVAYINQVGGQDALVFDGRSFITNRDGDCIGVAPAFAEHIGTFDTVANPIKVSSDDTIEATHDALVLSLRDYARKNGFKKAVVAVSGGIDSAVALALATRALGSENVVAVSMPSEFSSQHSIDDARALAGNLNVEFHVAPIKNTYTAAEMRLRQHIEWRDPGTKKGDVTAENLQARIRGNFIMAFANSIGALVVTTGNKSETSVGYCTLFGDTAGGFAILIDVYKTTVRGALARYINRDGVVIPERTITKPPSAELAPNQVDTDSLPDYEILDKILVAYIEQGKKCSVVAQELGISLKIVEEIVRLLFRNQYKRKFSPFGPKITPKALGDDWRFPVACKPVL